MLRHWKVQRSSKSKNIILPLKLWSKNLNIAVKNGITYLSSFIAICRGSVSPSSSTMTGAHILLETSQQIDRWSRCCITVNTLVATSRRLMKLPPNKQTNRPTRAATNDSAMVLINVYYFLGQSITYLVYKVSENVENGQYVQKPKMTFSNFLLCPQLKDWLSQRSK